MTTPNPVLQQYEAIAAISNEMADAALDNHWERLVDLGQRYRASVDVLREMGELTEADRNARRELLNAILRNDARIRELAHPELRRLRMLLGTMKRQQAVLQAYCSPVIYKEE
jgi:flagellar protein FliT